MKHSRICLTLALFTSLSGCTASAFTNQATPLSGGYYDNPGSASGNLASLLTGQIVTNEEQQLRDIKNRQIVLDFPIKVGVVFYQLGSKLEATDQEAQFEATESAFKDTGLVRETIRIPNSLISSAVTVDELRRLGSRFQCDIMLLVTGSHEFNKAKNQNLSFFDSFSDKLNYESQIKFNAIALDVYTGTLLSPFDAATKAGPFLLDRSAPDFATQSYAKQKESESKTWDALRSEALERLTQLKADVDKRKAQIADQASAQS